MRTAYDVLRRAVIKDFGKWYAFEWSKLSEEAKQRLRDGVAYQHFGNPFLSVLHNIYVGQNVVRGDLGWGGFNANAEFDALLSQLKVPFVFHWFVYSSFSCDDWFELKGFKSKSAAIAYYKKQMKRADGIFYTFWFKW